MTGKEVQYHHLKMCCSICVGMEGICAILGAPRMLYMVPFSFPLLSSLVFLLSWASTLRAFRVDATIGFNRLITLNKWCSCWATHNVYVHIYNIYILCIYNIYLSLYVCVYIYNDRLDKLHFFQVARHFDGLGVWGNSLRLMDCYARS